MTHLALSKRSSRPHQGGRSLRLRRRMVPPVLAALVLATGVACSSGDTGSDAGTGTSTGDATTPSRSTATLVVNASFVVKSLDPGTVYEATGNTAIRAMYESLLTFEGSDITTPVPDLAESFTASPDGLEHTFVLRKDVTFSDGTPMTADDVVFSFNRMQNLKGPGSFVADGLTISKTDDHTVVVSSEVPKPDVPIIMAMSQTAVLNSAVLKANGGTDAEDAATKDTATAFLDTQSAGTGPYTLEKFDATSQIELKLDDDYWGEAPHFPRIVMRNMDVQAQNLSMSKAGDNEIAIDIAGPLLEGLPAEVHKSGAQDTHYLLMASVDPEVSSVTANPAFLKALRLAVDYDGLVKLFGIGANKAAGLIPPILSGALPESEAPSTDIEEAKRVLAAAGLNEPKVTLTYPAITRRGVDLGTIVTKVSGDAAKAGITIELDPLPLSAFLTEQRSGDLEFLFTPMPLSYPSATSRVNQFEPGSDTSMRSRWSAKAADPSVAAAVEKVRAATSVADYTTAIEEWQRVMNEHSPIFALAVGSSFVVGSPNLTNVNYSPAGWSVDLTAVGAEAGNG